MKPALEKTVYWAPRIIGLLFAAFISIFALDVFDGSHSPGEMALAFLIHLLPTVILLVLVALSWRWEWFGALIFPALGIWYIVSSWGRFHWSAYATIAGPLLVLGALFLLSWLSRRPAPMPSPQS